MLPSARRRDGSRGRPGGTGTGPGRVSTGQTGRTSGSEFIDATMADVEQIEYINPFRRAEGGREHTGRAERRTKKSDVNGNRRRNEILAERSVAPRRGIGYPRGLCRRGRRSIDLRELDQSRQRRVDRPAPDGRPSTSCRTYHNRVHDNPPTTKKKPSTILNFGMCVGDGAPKKYGKNILLTIIM